MIQGFGQGITEIPAFGHDITEVRAMGKLAWQKQTSIPNYLCFTALEAGQFTLTIPAAVTATYLSYIEWSKNGRTWTHTDNTSDVVTIDVQVAQGDKVYWRGSGVAMGASYLESRRCKFSSSADFDVSGHIMSLLVGDNFGSFEHLTHVNTDGIYSATFSYLFKGCTTLVNARDLVLPTFTDYHIYIYIGFFQGCTALASAPQLPSTNLSQSCYNAMFFQCTSLVTPPQLPALRAQQNCYLQMFAGCKSLESAPELPATTLANQCYYQMLYDCSSIISAPALPATIMAYRCYYRMFEGCKFTSAPDLLATTLATECYFRMFYNCVNLNYVKCLATDISATDCLTNWLNGVSSTGTFIQAEGVTWPRGASGIPTGWVDVEKRTMPQGYKQVFGIKRTSSGYGIDIGHAYNVKYSRLEVAFKQDEISNGMVLQTKDSVAGKVWLYNYQGSSLAEKPFSFYTSNASNTQRGGTIYSPLDTNPHTVEVSSDGSRGTLKHDGITTTTGLNFSDLPESCTSNPYLFGYNFYYYGWIYYFKEWDSSDVALSDFVSCIRENDNVVGFYDFVSQTFKTAANTSAFTAGEEI